MTRQDRRADRQRAKANKQIKLVALLGIGFVGVLMFQFSGTNPTADVASSEPSGAVPASPEPAASAKADDPAHPSRELPRFEVAELVRFDPFTVPAPAVVAAEPVPAPVAAEKEAISFHAVYGNHQRARALLGNRVVAEGDLVTPQLQVAEIVGRRVRLSPAE